MSSDAERTPHLDDELIAVELRERERTFMVQALNQWGGPIFASSALAEAIGFNSVDEMMAVIERITDAVLFREPASRRNWTRGLLSAELAFASDVVGAGGQWDAIFGTPDAAEDFRSMRQLQDSLGRAGVIDKSFLSGSI